MYGSRGNSMLKVEGIENMKKCTKCNKFKHKKHFSKNNMSGDGLQNHCKQCFSDYRMKAKRDKQLKASLKICSGCGELKSKLEFHKNKLAKDGMQSRCKQCSLERKMEIRKSKQLKANSKTCSKCGETKPRSEFFKHSRSSDGKNCHCKTCSHSYLKKWRAEKQAVTPESITINQTKWIICPSCGETRYFNQFSKEEKEIYGDKARCNTCVRNSTVTINTEIESLAETTLPETVIIPMKESEVVCVKCGEIKRVSDFPIENLPCSTCIAETYKPKWKQLIGKVVRTLSKLVD